MLNASYNYGLSDGIISFSSYELSAYPQTSGSGYAGFGLCVLTSPQFSADPWFAQYTGATSGPSLDGSVSSLNKTWAQIQSNYTSIFNKAPIQPGANGNPDISNIVVAVELAKPIFGLQ